MDGIHQANESFDFSKITMISPTIIAGGNYFIKFRMNEIPLYVQTPKCKVKQGFIKSGKKLYCDLMFTRENEEFICWMENLENHCQRKIYENRQKWFETPLDEHDIENSFTSPLKLYKSGKFYLSRTNVPSLLGNCTLKIYNENEELVNPDDLKEEMDVISILEIQGIKCSARSFQIELELKQMLVMNPVNLFDKFVFKKTGRSEPSVSIPQESKSPVEEASHEEPLLEEMGLQEMPQNVAQEVEQNVAQEVGQEVEQNVAQHVEQEFTSEPLHTECLPEDASSEAFPQEFQEQAISNGRVASGDEENSQEYDDDEYDSDDEYRHREKIVIDHDNDLMEIDLDLDDFQEEEIHIKKRDDIYYEMYREAKRKAKLARDLAIASYLEAKNIKNTYMIMDDEDDSDLEEETFSSTFNKSTFKKG